MLGTLGIVQAWLELPRWRCQLARKFGGQPLLEWVVRRMTDCTRLDGVVVLSGEPADPGFVGHLVPSDVPVFVSNGLDPLARYVQALEEYPAEAVVRIRGDNPFIDPAVIDRLVIAAEADPRCDYVGYGSRDGRPAVLAPVGICAEWFRAKALRRAARADLDAADREHPTRYLYSHPEEFASRLIPVPPEIDRDDVRLSIDFEEDWEHALTLFEALGPERFDYQRIANLLSHQPNLRNRMAALNRVHAVP